jgi:hypothetical protein
MEPFFIFCSALVLYCSYLTIIDLLNDLEKERATLPLPQQAVQRAGRMIPAGRGEPSGRRSVACTSGRFPLLSRGAA